MLLLAGHFVGRTVEFGNQSYQRGNVGFAFDLGRDRQKYFDEKACHRVLHVLKIENFNKKLQRKNPTLSLTSKKYVAKSSKNLMPCSKSSTWFVWKKSQIWIFQKSWKKNLDFDELHGHEEGDDVLRRGRWGVFFQVVQQRHKLSGKLDIQKR